MAKTITRANRAALVNLWGDAGAWAADTWTELTGTYWDGLPYGGVVFGLTPHGACLGHCNAATGRITLHPSVLDPQSDEAWGVPATQLGVAYARDVLLHELVHVAFPAGHHNSSEWCGEIERITPLLGLKPIKAQPVHPRMIDGKNRRVARDGYLARAAIASWPHSLRTPSYYVRDNRKIHVPI
jgi:hypothetical protein